MRCPKCQNELEEHANFCSACGHNMIRDQAYGDRIAVYEEEEEAETWTIEEMEQQMVQPLSKAKRKRQMYTIVAVAVVCMAVIGAVYFFGRNHMDAQRDKMLGKNMLKHAAVLLDIRDEYYEQGMMLLDKATDAANRQRAIEIGGEAFLNEIDRFSNEADAFFQQAETETEKDFAEAVESVGLFSLSNDGEKAFIEEMGGRNDPAAEGLLMEREAQAKAFAQELREAKDGESIQALNQKIEQTNADQLQTS